MPSLLGQPLFPSDNPWNENIANAPVATNSSAIINNITSLYGNGRLHPDFGQDTQTANPLYGIPFNVVHGNTQPKVHVVIDAYPSQSDIKDVPIPAGAVLEGDQQNGPTAGVNTRGDSHLIVYDEDNNVAYEFYRASRPGENSDGQWHADQESVWDLKVDSFRPIGWTSADAAGLPILPGLVRPDEGLPVSQGGQGVINHAIRFTLQNKVILNQFVYPASHVANAGNTNAAIQPPMGTRFRLKAGVDISKLSPESQVIAQAMKDYGLILADNGSNFYFSGASASVDAGNHISLTWNDNDIQDSTHGLKSLHYGDFEVVDTTPAVTALGASGGTAGTTLTVVGQNFSGAAGQLAVLFGSTPATNVSVIDDSHLSATIPAGAGTVDVRVRSGVTTPSNPSNARNPIFGYGLSPVTASDRFTYTSGPPPANRPPVAQNDAATTAAGAAVTVSVLANDSDPDGDTITVTAATQGAHGAVVVNANNTLKYTPSAGFAGNDTFSYTIGDGKGGTASAAVTVTVMPANHPPVAVNDAATTRAGTAVAIKVLANDHDPDGDPFRVTTTAKAAFGVVIINPDSTLTYTPQAGFVGTDSFTYTISDGRGGTATATVKVTVKRR